MTVNSTLLRATLNHIEAHPERWDQNSLRSPSGCMCFAGRAVTLDGAVWAEDIDPDFVEDELLARDDDPPEHRLRGVDIPVTVLVEDRARRVLGLSAEQATRLFEPHNILHVLQTLVACYIAEDGGAA